MSFVPELPGLSGLTEIGRGGNGVVYRARQNDLSRIVAVKVLAARLDQNAATRFAREGHALGMVSGHPNIVPIYQAGTTANGEPFLVMQLCERGSLVDLIERGGPLQLPAVLDLGVRMAGALQTAHDAGILHRDIKPANILLDSYDAPRLADFGQARHSDASLTRTGDIVATPGYAAPEVLSGRPATPQSDVYSLAATMMAALLGRGPFARDTDESLAAILLRVVQEPPPNLRQIGVPDPAARLLEHSMAKDPAHRPPTAAAFGTALQQVQQQLGLPVTPLALAGQAPTGLLPVVNHGHVQPTHYLPTGSTHVPATVALAPAHQAGPTGGGQGQYAAGSVRSAKGTWWAKASTRWIALAAAIALIAAGTVLGIQLFSDPEPRAISDPAGLLVTADDLPGTWIVTDTISGLMQDALGTIVTDGDPVTPSTLAECMQMPTDKISKVTYSAAYLDSAITDGVPSSATSFYPKTYRFERSAGMIMTSHAAATAMVTPWSGNRYDECRLDNAKSIGATVGGESYFSDAPTSFTEPYKDISVPDTVTLAIRQIEVPLSQVSADEELGENSAKKGTRVFTVLAASAGTSVVYVVFQSSGATYDADVMGEIVDNVVAKLTE